MSELKFFFFFKQKTAYEIKECDWSSDVCSSDLARAGVGVDGPATHVEPAASRRRDAVEAAEGVAGRHIDRPAAQQHVAARTRIDAVGADGVAAGAGVVHLAAEAVVVPVGGEGGAHVGPARAGADNIFKLAVDVDMDVDRKSTRLNSSHIPLSRMPSSA